MSNNAIFKTVGVYTENEYLFQKIRLELLGTAEAVLLKANDGRVCDAYLVDADNPVFAEKEGLKMKREGGDVSLPFRIGSLAILLKNGSTAGIEMIQSKKSVRIGEKSVKLTELEYSLLSLLVSAAGNYVSREEILSSVWDSKADKGIINVYIHYLREKLETDGEKIILSSRNYGYKINEKYIGGRSDA